MCDSDYKKDILGYIGAFFLVITLLPQVIYTYKRKKAEDISYIFLFFQVTTCLLFLSYGILLEENPLIIANSIVLCLNFVLVYFRIIYSKKNKIHVISEL